MVVADEAGRLKALRQYRILDTEPEQAFDDLTLIASQICGVPIALISLVDEDRQWFKSRVGIEARESSRSVSFCAHAILQHGIFTIADASKGWPQRTYLTVMGLNARGRLVAPRDERFLIEVRTDMPLLEPRGDRWRVGGRGEPLLIRAQAGKTDDARRGANPEQTAEGTTRAGTMVEADPVRFRYEFPPSPASSTFDLAGGDDWLGPLKVERSTARRSPRLASGSRSPGRPPTAGAPRAPLPALLFLPDTEVELTLVGTEKLANIQLKVHPGSSPALKRLDDRTFPTRWTLREATTLEILLKSAETGLSSGPRSCRWASSKDREPRLALRAVGVGSRVTPVATIPLTIGATDDIGLAALRLQIDRTATVEEKDKIETKTQRTTVPFPLPLDPSRPVLDHQVRHDVLLQTEHAQGGDDTSLRRRGRRSVRSRRPDRPVRRARASGGLAG